ncbi:MAG: hypothetical protein BGO31_17410 [Bacteroidetes bacterium 43-16]|nr:MAG: hypothetical protein BGO31_17410 [Bacteroidetes bacterium 43-16]
MIFSRQNLELLALFLLIDAYIGILLVYFVYYLPNKRWEQVWQSESLGHLAPGITSGNYFLKPIMNRSKRTYQIIIAIATVLMIVVLGMYGYLQRDKKQMLERGKDQEGLALYQQDTALINELGRKAVAILAADTDSAIVLLEQVLVLNKKYDNKATEVKTLSQLASCYIRKGDYEKTLSILDEAFEKVKEVNDPDLVAVLYNASAIIYQQHGKYSRSIYNYFEGLNTLKEKGLSHSLRAAKMYSNLAGLFILLEENAQALKFLQEARAILDPENPDHRVTLAYVLCNSGIIKASDNTSGAATDLNASLAIVQAVNDPYLSNKILINLSDLSLLQQDYKAADSLLDEALLMAKKTKNPISILLTNYGIGHAYLVRGDYAHAISPLEAAYRDSKKSGYNDALITITKDLKEAYAKTGNYSKAFAIQEEYLNQKDQVRHNEKKQTFELLMQFQAAEKDKQLARSQLEIAQQEIRIREKNIWLGVFVIGTFLLITLFGLLLFSFRSKQKLQEEQLKSVGQQRDIERLSAAFEGEERERTRISRDIHDGVMSTFATVKMRIKKLEDDIPLLAQHGAYSQTMSLFEQATSELRRTAHHLMPDLLLEDGLYKAVFYFAQNIEENTGIKVKMEYFGDAPELPQNFVLFLYRAIQELVQNVVKHAHASQILIQLIYGNDTINITVDDNGTGFDPGTKTGMGLKSLQNRTKLYNGTFNISSNLGEGTSVTLDFVL